MEKVGRCHTGCVFGKRIEDHTTDEKLQIENKLFRNGTIRLCRGQRSECLHNGGVSFLIFVWCL